jgi:hypothetical protein
VLLGTYADVLTMGSCNFYGAENSRVMSRVRFRVAIASAKPRGMDSIGEQGVEGRLQYFIRNNWNPLWASIV